ncbi:VUT family protein [Amycolatopsis australiensis]|uniref:VUT family protein n=1 Tax=Amycolatopsis australiensis TaxID=546364 RepID=UPI001C43370D|nr:VUT family protein [Amycolatopsis australiensis]
MPTRSPRRPAALALLIAYVASITLGNVATTYFGVVPAGFGLTVTAGTFASGLAMSFRDHLQDVAGLRWVTAGIAAGITVSAISGDLRIAVASAVAFTLGELADLAIYTPMRLHCGFRHALIVSNAVGALIDTWLFLTIAGLPRTTDLVAGQLLVKAVWITGLYLLVREAARRAVPRQPQLAEGA